MINFKNYLKEEIVLDQLFDIIEDYITDLSIRDGVDSEVVWEFFEKYDVDKLFGLAEDWQDAKHKNPDGGLTKSGVMAYRRENPGSKLQTAVTTKPSKLKPALRKWNC